MEIRVLPEKVASAIAAGEVVERPASVVKELVENALDAGAKSIAVEVTAAGRSNIQVSDDGAGIPSDELSLAVGRYATSKLQTMDDLFAIRTLGFRGEALASIAAVSRLQVVSRTAEETAGARLVVEGGDAGQVTPVGVPPGTMVEVRDLFFNVPARRKFLKSDATEKRRITELITRYALAYPEVRFELVFDGRTGFHSTGTGDAREVLASVYGVETAKQMLAVSPSAGAPVQVSGFVSPPSVHRTTRKELTFFVNGRWVGDASLSAAVLQAYHTLLMVGRFPIAVLYLKLPAEAVDVNVHPAKTEVRFRDPGVVFTVVQRTVRATLLGQAGAPGLDFGRPRPPTQASSRAIGPDWLAADAALHGPEAALARRGQELPRLAGDVPLLRAVGQVGAAYLVAEGPDGIYLIDQHAAHERVLFESLMDAWKAGDLKSQALLEPETVELTPAQASLLQDQLEPLARLGFAVEEFGRGAFRVRAVPTILQGIAPSQALLSVVEDFEEDEEPLREELEALLAARVCKRAAVKAGQVLSIPEQERLLRDLEACDAPRSCPHGRPTMIHLSVDALERQFGKRG